MHRPLSFVMAPRIDGAPVSRSGTTLQLGIVLIGVRDERLHCRPEGLARAARV